MLLLQANQIQKSYGARTILNDASLAIHQGERVGIVGGNGAGKTTLLDILSGELLPDEGTVQRTCEAAYIRQFGERDSTRSGGENAKAQIQREMEAQPGILFADEPTANLDAKGQAWVLEKLRQAETVVVVSHDRVLLDNICTRIVEVKEGEITSYTGSYSDYEKAAALQQERQRQAEEEYRKKKAQLEAAIEGKHQKLARQRQNKRRQYAKTPSEARLGKDKRKASMKKQEVQAKVLTARLERLEPVERQKEPPSLRIDFSLTHPPEGRRILTCEGLSFSYPGKEILQDASFVVERDQRVAVTGDNGAGKTTLLRLIHQGHPAIRQSPRLQWGWLRQDFSQIDPAKTVLENTLAESVQEMAGVRSALAGLLFRGDDVYKQAGNLSGGEKIRLSLAMLLTASCNALLLDEPTNYLDIVSLEAVAAVLRQYPGVILFVSHDGRFSREVATTQLIVKGGKVLSEDLYRQQKKKSQAGKPDPARILLLETRSARILGEIGSAPPQRKELLEAEYAQTMEELRRLKEG